MKVFILGIYLCSMMYDPDISEQVCRMENSQYFEDVKTCVAAAQNAQLVLDAQFQQATCSMVVVI